MSDLLFNISSEITGKQIYNKLLDNIVEYPAIYKGDLNEISLYGCRFVANRFNDIFDEESKKLVMTETLKLPYLDLVHDKAEKNKILVWFGPSWFLAGLKVYYQEDENLPNFEIFNTQDGYLIFTEFINTEDAVEIAAEADELFSNINLQFNLYDDFNYRAVENYTIEQALDVKQLFPLDFFKLGNYLVFASNELSDKQLEYAVKYYRFIKGVSRVDVLIGTFAAYLTMEQTDYLHPIKWIGNGFIIDRFCRL